MRQIIRGGLRVCTVSKINAQIIGSLHTRIVTRGADLIARDLSPAPGYMRSLYERVTQSGFRRTAR